jgi:predicted dehydrogenase
MNPTTRRGFLKQGGLGAAGAVALTWAAPTIHGADAGEQPVLAIIGCGGRGMGVAAEMRSVGARFAYVCDCDQNRLQKAKETLEAGQAVADLRRVLDDKSVDAVLIGTPDHWHAPATILACNAGKHVYVEKPCCHNIREGRLMVEAARKNNRVVQVGTQSRSTPAIQKAIQMLRQGAIGDVLVAKAWNSQRRSNIGHAEPSDPPANLDYDMWIGPAPMVPYRKTCDHYGWRWNYQFGTGDAGNDGVHEMDIARWGLGMEIQPSMVIGYGSKLFFDDDQQFPDTQYVTFEYPGDGTIGKKRLLVYEHRIWSNYRQESLENGNAFYGTGGMMILGKNDGWKLFGPKNKLIAEEPSKGDTTVHVKDFFDAIRENRKPNADVEIGHLSASLSHLANIAARTGHGQLRFDPENEQILDDPEANELVRRKYRDGHWAVPAGV